jgi:hypothetical protein
MFSNLIHKNTVVKGNYGLLLRFEMALKSTNVMLYPSSGNDTTDILYVNNSRLQELGELNPRIFIHCDYLYSVDHYPIDFERNNLSYPDFSIVDSCKLISINHHNNEAKQSINLYQIKRINSDDKLWLLFFRGYYNEYVLQTLLNHKIKTAIVYAVCDGITHGMGSCNEQQIPTLLYPLLSEALGIQYIITEQTWASSKHRFENKNNIYNGKDECRVWLENIDQVYPKQEIEDVLKLSDEEIRAFLITKLSVVKEHLINSNDKLRCFDIRFLNSLALKTISPKKTST